MLILILKYVVLPVVIEIILLPYTLPKIALKALHPKWKAFKATLQEILSRPLPLAVYLVKRY